MEGVVNYVFEITYKNVLYRSKLHVTKITKISILKF